MENIIVECEGDLNEYHRVNRYIRYKFNENVPDKFNEYDSNFIKGYTDENDPVFNLKWKKAKTKQLRSKYLQNIIESPYRSTNYSFCNQVSYPSEYILALFEDEIQEIYDMAAIVIQKHVKGVILRKYKGVHNPTCDIGKRFLRKMFLQL